MAAQGTSREPAALQTLPSKGCNQSPSPWPQNSCSAQLLHGSHIAELLHFHTLAGPYVLPELHQYQPMSLATSATLQELCIRAAPTPLLRFRIWEESCLGPNQAAASTAACQLDSLCMAVTAVKGHSICCSLSWAAEAPATLYMAAQRGLGRMPLLPRTRQQASEFAAAAAAGAKASQPMRSACTTMFHKDNDSTSRPAALLHGQLPPSGLQVDSLRS